MSECTGFRIAYGHGAASGCDAGIGKVYDATMVGLAMALDYCQDEAEGLRGSYGGLGHGGCWVEACFAGDPHDADTEAELIDGLDDIETICGDLPFGDRSAARRFRVSQRDDTVWNGNNHVPCSTEFVDELLSRRR